MFFDNKIHWKAKLNNFKTHARPKTFQIIKKFLIIVIAATGAQGNRLKHLETPIRRTSSVPTKNVTETQTATRTVNVRHVQIATKTLFTKFDFLIDKTLLSNISHVLLIFKLLSKIFTRIQNKIVII